MQANRPFRGSPHLFRGEIRSKILDSLKSIITPILYLYANQSFTDQSNLPISVTVSVLVLARSSRFDTTRSRTVAIPDTNMPVHRSQGDGDVTFSMHGSWLRSGRQRSSVIGSKYSKSPRSRGRRSHLLSSPTSSSVSKSDLKNLTLFLKLHRSPPAHLSDHEPKQPRPPCFR